MRPQAPPDKLQRFKRILVWLGCAAFLVLLQYWLEGVVLRHEYEHAPPAQAGQK
jgi:hypothetical protein